MNAGAKGSVLLLTLNGDATIDTKSLFDDEGLPSEAADDPEDALDRIRRRLDEDDPFSVLLVDLGRASPPDECAWMERILERDPELQIVFVNAPQSWKEEDHPPFVHSQIVLLPDHGPDAAERLQFLVTGAVLARRLEKALSSVRGGFNAPDLAGELESARHAVHSMRKRVLKAMEAETYLATHDPLTGLPNLPTLLNRLDFERRRLQLNSSYRFSLLRINLNHFKIISEITGRRTGDALLIDLGQRLKQAIRATDLVCRIGSDEYAIVLSETHLRSDVRWIAQRIRDATTCPLTQEGRRVPLSASVGGVIVDTPWPVDTILRNAGLAMDKARALPGGAVVFYESETDQHEMLQRNLEIDVLRGLDDHEFTVDYQPIIVMETGRIVGFEALVRWNHRVHGLIMPGHFIPGAEQNGMIEPLGSWILDKIIEDVADWSACVDKPFFVAANVSRRQMFDEDFANRVLKRLAEAGIGADRLCMELTETVAIGRYEIISRNLKTLRGEGIRIFIDDFGVGYSSLHALERLEADVLKIDRSFVVAAARSEQGRTILRAIAEMSRAMGVSLVAEGIETDDELRAVQEVHCEYGQGFRFSKAVNARAALDMLRGGRRWTT